MLDAFDKLFPAKGTIAFEPLKMMRIFFMKFRMTFARTEQRGAWIAFLRRRVPILTAYNTIAEFGSLANVRIIEMAFAVRVALVVEDVEWNANPYDAP